MAFSTPTFTQTRAFLHAFFKVLLPDRDASPYRLLGKLITWVAGAVTDVHAHVDSAERDLMPDTAEGDGLVRWGGILEVDAKGATPARKSNALRVTGTSGTPILTGEALTDPVTGLRFQVNEDEVVPVAGFVDVDILAIDVGSQTRLAAGTQLQFDSPPAGIATIAELQLDMDEDGEDEELEGAHRLRVLAVLGDRPLGGSPSDFVAWALEVVGVSAAYCYPNRAGLGSIDVAALHTGSGSERLLTSGERDDLLDHLRSQAPGHLASAGGDLRVVEVVLETVNIEVTVESNGDPAYQFQWDDSTALTVSAWNAADRQLTFTGTRPASMKAGHSIIIKPAAGGDGAPIVIEALVSTNAVILEEAPSQAPANPDTVYSSGPLVPLVRDAILAHLNGEIVYAGAGVPLPASTAASSGTSTVRLQVLAEPIGTANPAREYGSWSGAVIRAVLAKIATYPTGALNAEVIAPATDTEATDYAIPDDDQVGILSPGRVIVRRKW